MSAEISGVLLIFIEGLIKDIPPSLKLKNRLNFSVVVAALVGSGGVYAGPVEYVDILSLTGLMELRLLTVDLELAPYAEMRLLI